MLRMRAIQKLNHFNNTYQYTENNGDIRSKFKWKLTVCLENLPLLDYETNTLLYVPHNQSPSVFYFLLTAHFRLAAS